MSDKKPFEPDINLDDVPQFIRTFERDAAALSRGERPELTALRETSAAAAARSISLPAEKSAAPEAADTASWVLPPVELAAKAMPPPATQAPEVKTYEKAAAALTAAAPFSGMPTEPQAEPIVLQERIIVPPGESIADIGRTVENESREDVLARLRAKAEEGRVRMAQGVPMAAPAPSPQATRALEEEAERAAALARLRAKVEAERPVPPPAPPVPPPETDELRELREKRERERREIEARLEGAPQRVLPTEPSASHTYDSDFTRHIEETGAGKVAVLAAEADTTPPVHIVSPEEHRTLVWNRVFIGVGVLFLVGSVVSAYLVNEYRLKNPETIAPAPTVTVPLFVDDRVQVAGTSAALEEAIVRATAAPLTVPGVRLLYLGSGTSTVTDLFGALSFPIPNILLRNLNRTGSIAGAVNVTGVPAPFFILSVVSYRDTFAGMLAWEPRMARDLSGLFPTYPTTIGVTAPTDTATATLPFPGSAPETTAPRSGIVLLGFSDEVIANQDVRVYRDESGKSRFLYGYWNPQTLIIARDEAAFSELVNRLGGTRSSK